MNQTTRLAVLGTGRMGQAMATRLAAHHPVVTWSRSGRRVPGIDAAPSAAAAVKDADVALLALFDAHACMVVLDDVLPELPPDAVVVNTATVAPHEASLLADLVRRSGHRYLHAPVMGSVPAVLAGELTILAAGPIDDQVGHVLETLGLVVPSAGPAVAAAAKLVAIGVLGDSLVAIRRALARGDELGLDRAFLLSVLERSPLGGLVQSKRVQLERPTRAADAEFSVEALAKDLQLIAAATGAEHCATPLIEALRARTSLADRDDVAAVAVAAGPAYRFPDARLTVAPDVTAPPEVLEPLHAYALGHATGSADHFRRAFRETARIEGMRDGAFTSWDLAGYCRLFDGPAPDEGDRRRVLEAVHVAGTVATASMSLHHGADVFTDVFLLLRDGGGWRIANKAYHRRPAAEDVPPRTGKALETE